MIGTILNDRNLVLYFAGRFISSLGDNFLLFAQSIAAYLLTDSLAGVGALWIVRGVASLLLIPVGGVLTDRANRKTIILVTDFISGVLSISYIFITQGNHYWLLPLLAFASQSVNRFSSPALNASFKDVSQSTDLEISGSFAAILGQTAVIIGPVVASIVYFIFNGKTDILFIADGVSFFISFIFMCGVYFGKRTNPETKKIHFYRDMFNGMNYIKENKPLLFLIILLIPIALTGKTFEVLVLGISEMKWGIGTIGGIGIYLSLFALGGIVGSTQIHKWKHLMNRRRFYAVSTMMLGLLFILMGLLDYLWMSLLITFFVGVFSNVTVTMAQIHIQKMVENNYLGRVFSAWTLLAVIGGGIGAYLSGLFYDQFGLRVSLILFGAFIAVPYAICFLIVWLKRICRTGEY